MSSALAADKVHLQEWRQQLESLVCTTKVVYDGDVAKVDGNAPPWTRNMLRPSPQGRRPRKP
ncbi:hypothetical protein E2562_017320 [Oryza meyeriana var. granulata]|uniref:Uncharacterized protein n=1 Tax=Oryza meyeriana var. granulata TaxID=110450 RepID=A0A6G1BXV9_9ORYZ|nr:hypothetical protein E2562_017320 [Oryza meyeriana var. granulata]